MDILKNGLALSNDKAKDLRPLAELANSLTAIELKAKVENSLIRLYVFAEHATLKQERVNFKMMAETLDEFGCENLWLELQPLKAVSLLLNKKVNSKYAFNTSSPFDEYYMPGDEFLLWEVPFSKIEIDGVHYLPQSEDHPPQESRVVEYEWDGNTINLFCPNYPQRKISITAPKLNILSKLVPEFSKGNKVLESIPKNQVVSTINESLENPLKGISEAFPKKRKDGFDYSSLYKKNPDGSVSKGPFFHNVVLQEKKVIE